MPSPLREKLRGKLLGLNNRRSAQVTVEIEGEELCLEVREPTVADRDAILAAGGLTMADIVAAEGDAEKLRFKNLIQLFIECCLRCTFILETGEPLFVPADLADFQGRPAQDGTGWMASIANAVFLLMKPSVEKKASPSPKTPQGSSSSESPKPPDAGTSTTSPSESSPVS